MFEARLNQRSHPNEGILLTEDFPCCSGSVHVLDPVWQIRPQVADVLAEQKKDGSLPVHLPSTPIQVPLLVVGGPRKQLL